MKEHIDEWKTKFKTKICKVEVWLSIYCLFQDDKYLSLDLEK